MRRLSCAGFVVLLVAAGCQEQRAAVAQMQTGLKKLSAFFAPADVGLTVNDLQDGQTVVVDVTNSKLNSAGEEVRAALAREAATLTATLYPEAKEIQILFYSHGGFIVTVTKLVASYTFTPEELRGVRASRPRRSGVSPDRGNTAGRDVRRVRARRPHSYDSISMISAIAARARMWIVGASISVVLRSTLLYCSMARG